MYHIFHHTIRQIIFITLMMNCHLVFADSFESLLMPGPVINAHEKVEDDCDQCHDTSNKDRQGQLCVQCHAHENILDDINGKTGFHGRLPKLAVNNCKHCHTDHEGRDADIVLLNASTFDHKNTDFALKGIHEKTACNACHKADKKYNEASVACISCHKQSDVHDGEQGKKCGSCHTAANWKQTAFKHENTDFPLKGIHKKTSCSACHINQKYKDTPKSCISCHQIDDSHRGGFGEKCGSCHNTERWDKTTFDHDKKTDFPLYGEHKKAACNSCHHSHDKKPIDLEQQLPKECYGCHKNDDSHKSRYGKKCGTCHTSSSWQKQKFDHGKKTKFPLHGKHKKTTCNQCHKGELYEEELTGTCIDCHKKDDVHRGKQGRECNSCHNAKGWHDKVLFEHDLSPFPLIGMHATTQCEECHISKNFTDTESACNKCHAADDVHKTRLGTDCQSCHNPNSWFTWLFDHNTASSFKIDGSHKELGCYDCHQTASKGKLKATKDCISCHRSRDIHNRLFGRQCGDCHSTKSFKDINIKR